MSDHKMAKVTVYFIDNTSEVINVDYDKVTDFIVNFGGAPFNLQTYCNGMVLINVDKVKMIKYVKEESNV